MSDNIEQQPQHSSETTKMSEPEASPNPIHNISFTIWPPSQRTRDAVTTRLIETLTSESVLSKRYGTFAEDEAVNLAKKIEEEAFLSVGEGLVKDDEDGIETLQLYSKEISKRMLEAVKSRSENSSAPVADVEEEKIGSADVAAEE